MASGEDLSVKKRTDFQGVTKRRHTRPEPTSNEAGFPRQMRPVNTANEAGLNVRRDRFFAGSVGNDSGISACTLYWYVPKQTGGWFF